MRKITIWLAVLCLGVMISCSQEDNDDTEVDHQPVGIIKKKIEQTSYGEEIGFQLKTPAYRDNEIQTTITVEGEVRSAEDLPDEHIWIVVTGSSEDSFDYYVPIESGVFTEQITVHEGAGEYEISMRAPSNKQGEEDVYYNVATFTVDNTDEEERRDIAYTQFGVTQGIHIEQPTFGMNEVDETVHIQGSVAEDYTGDFVLIQIEKDDASEQMILQVRDQSFSSDIPMYFGTGTHKISIQLFNDEDEFYYESAFLYADNQTEATFAQVDTFLESRTYGIELQAPSYTSKQFIEGEAYEVKGSIDTTLPGANEITHVIAKVHAVEEEVEANYIFPVVDGAFSGDAYFRFGPGEYEVQVMIPDLTRQDENIQYLQTIAQAFHEVDGVDDQRDLLPSQGIESKHPSIVEKAEELTEDITSEREKARAIYAFVAQHVAYDVEKYETENSLTRLYDSALAALESGEGVCQDYAYLAIALLRAIGMEAHYVTGQAGELHAWVEVKVDGEWIEMDPTWGAGYVQDGVFHFNYNEQYFDPDPAFFESTHTRDEIKY